MKLQNKVMLITYPDSLGNNLQDLNWVLNHYLKEAIGGIHLLPFSHQLATEDSLLLIIKLLIQNLVTGKM